jgi:secretion/DNA translocation related CpaE-like protein
MDVSATPAPLLVSADELLIAEVLRLAAAAGVVPGIARDLSSALRVWPSAPVVLIGSDLAEEVALLHAPRRPNVHVVGHGPVPDGLFRSALQAGAENVAELPLSETWLIELLTDVGDGASVPGVTIGVVGGSGGAGATVFAAALALGCRPFGSTLLVDADPLGAGVDRVLGMECLDGVRWDALLQATGRLSARSLRETLPQRDGLAVLTWPVDRANSLQAFAMREVLSAGRRGFDTLVLDLPRHPDQVIDEVLARCDHIVLVSTLTVPAVTSASRVARRLPPAPRRHLVTRGGHAGVSPGEVSKLLGVPLLSAMADQRGLDESVNLGAGPLRSRRGTLARAARECAGLLVEGRAAAA